MLGVGEVAAVVLDVEPDARHAQPEQRREQQPLPHGVGPEDQHEVGRDEHAEDDRGLEVHLPAVALAPSGGAEILVDAAAKLGLKAEVFANSSLRMSG